MVSFSQRIYQAPPEDLSFYTGLSEREAEVLHYLQRDYTDEEIAEEMGVKVSTVDSFKSKIRRKADEAKTNLRSLMETGVYEPTDVHVEFTPKTEDQHDLNLTDIENHVTEFLEYEQAMIDDLEHQARELSRLAHERRKEMIAFKADLAKEGVIQATPWETMHKEEKEYFVRQTVEDLESVHEHGAPEELVYSQITSETLAEPDEITHAMDRLRTRGEVYEPKMDHYRTV